MTTDTDTVKTEADAVETEAKRPALETRVPPGESPAECPYCERPLESDDLLALHKGLDHWESLSDAERETFREAYADESESLRTFRLKILGILVVVYFAFLFVYSYYTTDPFSASLLAVAGVPDRLHRAR